MKPTNHLDAILKQKQIEVDVLLHATAGDEKHPLNQILSQSYAAGSHFSKALKQPSLAVIAEVKRRSPTLGEIRQIEDPVKLALEYCRGGASAISVLTDAEGFGGSLTDLSQVAESVRLHYPDVAILRKDFIIHPLQLAEAVSAGAHAILLIACALGSKLKPLLQEAYRLGLEVLTEVHDLADLELAIGAEAPIIGINHRNLTTFKIDFTTSTTLRPLIPRGTIIVAESGIHTPLQALQMHDLGYSAILVGEALVRAKDPAALIRLMLGESDEG